MSERPRDLRDLVGDDVPPDELAELERVHALLRSVPAPPPEIPRSLTQAVAASARERAWRPRRFLPAAALAAALAALFFGLGAWLDGDGSDYRRTVALQATEHAPRAAGHIDLGDRDEGGNWELRLETSGLPKLPAGGYYVLWLAKDGEYAATCGTFNVGDGTTTVTMNASYRLADYDAWVVSAVRPGQTRDTDPPWLLEAKISET